MSTTTAFIRLGINYFAVGNLSPESVFKDIFHKSFRLYYNSDKNRIRLFINTYKGNGIDFTQKKRCSWQCKNKQSKYILQIYQKDTIARKILFNCLVHKKFFIFYEMFE